jgi:hypothetical protein
VGAQLERIATQFPAHSALIRAQGTSTPAAEARPISPRDAASHGYIAGAEAGLNPAASAISRAPLATEVGRPQFERARQTRKRIVRRFALRTAMAGCVAWMLCYGASAASATQQHHGLPSKHDLSALQRLLAVDAESAQPLEAKIYDSGYINTGHKIFWADNETVLFQGHRRSDHHQWKNGPIDARTHYGPPVYRWTYRTGTVQQYVDSAKGFCYRDGKVWYQYEPPKGEPYVVVGKMGSERREPPVTLRADDRAGLDFMRCEMSWRIYSDFERRTGLKHHHLLVLRAEHGVIDRGPSTRLIGRIGDPEFAVKLYGPNSKTGIELWRNIGMRRLPVRFMHFHNDVFGREGYYYPFADVYLFYSPMREENPHHIGDWPKHVPYPVYIFKPSGRVETITLPAGPWANTAAVALTRRGIYVLSDYLQRDARIADNSGGFLVRLDASVVQITRGLTKSQEVSPDGCKIALAHLPKGYESDLSQYAMTVIELCKGATK